MAIPDKPDWFQPRTLYLRRPRGMRCGRRPGSGGIDVVDAVWCWYSGGDRKTSYVLNTELDGKDWILWDGDWRPNRVKWTPVVCGLRRGPAGEEITPQTAAAHLLLEAWSEENLDPPMEFRNLIYPELLDDIGRELWPSLYEDEADQRTGEQR